MRRMILTITRLKKHVTESDTLAADLVVMRHVLEHIQNPYKFLHMLQSLR